MPLIVSAPSPSAVDSKAPPHDRPLTSGREELPRGARRPPPAPARTAPALVGEEPIGSSHAGDVFDGTAVASSGTRAEPPDRWRFGADPISTTSALSDDAGSDQAPAKFVNVAAFRRPFDPNVRGDELRPGAQDLFILLRALNAHVPAEVTTYVGSYGYDTNTALLIHRVRPNAKYMPMFAPRPNLAQPSGPRDPLLEGAHATDLGPMPWTRKHYELDPRFAAAPGERYTLDPRKALVDADGQPRVAVDPVTGIASRDMSESILYGWGQETGRRVRDHLRGKPWPRKPDGWQLDLRWPSEIDGGASSRELLGFYAGVLDGAHVGRIELGDKPLQGLVHLPQPRALFGLRERLDADGRDTFDRFIAALDRTSCGVVGETSLTPQGNPRERARSLVGDAIEALRGLGTAGRRIAERYSVGLISEERDALVPGQHGGRGEAEAETWRAAFIDESRRLCGSVGEVGLRPAVEQVGEVEAARGAPAPGGGEPALGLVDHVFQDIGRTYR